jgi:regulator of protease activity HflC (stomatin/prohibitin superfamily)
VDREQIGETTRHEAAGLSNDHESKGDAMNAIEERDDGVRGPGRRGPTRRGPFPAEPRSWPPWGLAVFGLACLVLGSIVVVYNACKIEVGTGEQAVLIRREGLDLDRDMELAPPRKDGKTYYKGVQTEGPNGGVLLEGRYFYNPFYWSWEVMPQFTVPANKIGIRIALSGDELPAGQILAEPGQKGILREVLKPGRYPYNPYAQAIELHDLITVPSGFRGVVTLLSGSDPGDPNLFLVEPGERGVQLRTLEPGTYPLNPYETRVSLVDCRSKRFNLGQDTVMDFLSADGFPITLDGAIEFRVLPEQVAEVFVKYNEDNNGDAIDEEIIAKIITPESRSLCRIGGSRLTGGQFISGDEREKFQRDLVESLTRNCKEQGIEILAVAITSIQPPEEIAEPVRLREVAKQQLAQYQQEKIQQLSEAQLRVQQVLADQKQKLVEAEQGVVEKTTRAEQDQQVAVTLAGQQLKVAETQLEAAKDKASAIVAKAQAEADVIRFNNKAELAGLAARVSAFDGDGGALARNILIGKLAPAFQTILSNSEGPLMDLFSQFTPGSAPANRSTPVAGRPGPSTETTPAPEGIRRAATELPQPPFAAEEDRP